METLGMQLEHDAGDERACTHAIRAGQRKDRAKATAVETGIGTAVELDGCTGEVSGRRGRRQLHPVEHIVEFHANVQVHALRDPEAATEVGVLYWLAEAPVEPKRAVVCGPLTIRNIVPGVRIQHDGLGRIEAMAVDVDRIGVVRAAVIGPIH